jgi:hypothetical protein
MIVNILTLLRSTYVIYNFLKLQSSATFRTVSSLKKYLFQLLKQVQISCYALGATPGKCPLMVSLGLLVASKKAGRIKVTTQPRLSSRITNFSFEKQQFLNCFSEKCN